MGTVADMFALHELGWTVYSVFRCDLSPNVRSHLVLQALRGVARLFFCRIFRIVRTRPCRSPSVPKMSLPSV